MYQPAKRAAQKHRALYLASGEAVGDPNGTQAEREAWMRERQAQKRLLGTPGSPIYQPSAKRQVERHPNSIIVRLAEQIQKTLKGID
jgi:hypothetical protein